MMFKNLCIYRLPKPWLFSIPGLDDQFEAKALLNCGPSDAQSIGWIQPRDAFSFMHIVNGQILLALGVEQKLLPASVVKTFAADKARAIEEAEGRRVGRKEMRELRELATAELLPKAFIRSRRTFGWIDPVNGWLVIDAATPAKADEFLEHLRKTVEGFPAKLLKVNQSPSAAMTGWVAGGEAPTGFSIDQDLELRSCEKATVRYAKHALEGEDIREHIASGKVCTKLAMTWNDRISFVLNDNLQIKRLTFLDILKEQNENAENADERFDLDFTLMAGELARLLDDLVQALGGEQAGEAVGCEQGNNPLLAGVAAAADKLNKLALEDGHTMTIEHKGGVLATFGEVDPLYDQAVAIVLTNRRASISLVQRHLRIGYNRSARLIEDMAKAGVVSAQDSTGARKVLQ